jgi:hypothetical protein
VVDLEIVTLGQKVMNQDEKGGDGRYRRHRHDQFESQPDEVCEFRLLPGFFAFTLIFSWFFASNHIHIKMCRCRN